MRPGVNRAGPVLAAALAVALAVGFPESAVTKRMERSPKVLVATSGNRSETRKTIPISKRPGAERRVVMSMTPRDLPDLKAGDRLVTSAELMVTLDCAKLARSCAGQPYRYNPRVGARLVLARSRNATRGSRVTPISAQKRITCRGKPQSSRQHHCVIVFEHATLSVRHRRALTCGPGSCRVNLVLDAHSGRAKHGDKLVIGNNRPSGRVGQDKGRINVIRLRRAHSRRHPRRSRITGGTGTFPSICAPGSSCPSA